MKCVSRNKSAGGWLLFSLWLFFVHIVQVAYLEGSSCNCPSRLTHFWFKDTKSLSNPAVRQYSHTTYSVINYQSTLRSPLPRYGNICTPLANVVTNTVIFWHRPPSRWIFTVISGWNASFPLRVECEQVSVRPYIVKCEETSVHCHRCETANCHMANNFCVHRRWARSRENEWPLNV
jgi:hypothetical protein